MRASLHGLCFLTQFIRSRNEILEDRIYLAELPGPFLSSHVSIVEQSLPLSSDGFLWRFVSLTRCAIFPSLHVNLLGMECVVNVASRKSE